MRSAPTVFGLMVMLILVGSPSVGAGDLAAAKAHYAAASYEEALSSLGPVGEDEESVVVESHLLRALCLLALGRTTEAESMIERLVRHDPRYVMPSADVSPKLVTLFTAVRHRTLPPMAREAYEIGKAQIDAREWAAAREAFARVVDLLSDSELANQRDTGLNDLRQLSLGFLRLSELELAANRPPIPAQPPTGLKSSGSTTDGTASQAPRSPEGASTTPIASSASGTESQAASAPIGDPGQSAHATPPTQPIGRPSSQARDDSDGSAAAESRQGPPVFTALDQEVAPPVEILRRMPRWTPGTRGAQARAVLTGLLEIVIDERGLVESAAIARSITPSYDEVLVQAALSWRFTPAKRDGKPVRYRQVLEIVLRPTRVE